MPFKNDHRKNGYDSLLRETLIVGRQTILQLRNEKSAEAVPLFSKAIELRTELPEVAYYGRALANEDVGNLKAAYTDLQQATSLKPNWDAPRRDLARYKVSRR